MDSDNMLSQLDKHLGITRRPGVFHKHIAEKMKLKLKPSTNVLQRECAVKIINAYGIPYSLYYDFFIEMQDMGLIKVVNKTKIEIIYSAENE